MERNKTPSDDYADYHGSVERCADAMKQIQEALKNLIEVVKDSEEYIRYQKIKERVNKLPELEQEINQFRRENYFLQNSQGTVDLYEETDRMEQEYSEFRKNPIVAEYLEAENALCRIVQQINWMLIEELDFEVGFED